jgi:hypothetical protein
MCAGLWVGSAFITLPSGFETGGELRPLKWLRANIREQSQKSAKRIKSGGERSTNIRVAAGVMRLELQNPKWVGASSRRLALP